MKKTVIELFAGVGGFRVGLNNIKKIDKDGKAIEKGQFNFLWSNQWEPSTKVQYAYECYKMRFGEKNNSNVNIHLVDKNTIPDHTLLCGGFPCQDYSVARTKSNEQGIQGKKGALWWDINEILEIKKPPFVLLENVDRLIKSPANQRGRDFSVMLYCFYKNGYGVEWRVINAGEYGMPQRRRRVYIFAFKEQTKYYEKIRDYDLEQIIITKGIYANQFPVSGNKCNKIFELDKYASIFDVSNSCIFKYENAGCMLNGKIFTTKVMPRQFPIFSLNKIIEKDVIQDYFLDEKTIEKFKYLRSKKKILRIKPNGEKYYYCEGSMTPFDALNLPGRTMLTSEGTVNRSSHFIRDPYSDRMRKLTPLECERLNQFPDNWTKSGMPERKRYFMMGNALVCGIIYKIGEKIAEIIEGED